MNQFMQNLVCESFPHVLLKYGHENVEMQIRKFDDITLRYSIAEWINYLYICITNSNADSGIFTGVATLFYFTFT